MVVSFFREIIFRSQKTNKTSVFYIFVKILNVRILETPVIYVVEPYLDIWSAKCQVNIFFRKHIAQKPYLLMTSFFQTSILSISGHRPKIKMKIL